MLRTWLDRMLDAIRTAYGAFKPWRKPIRCCDDCGSPHRVETAAGLTCTTCRFIPRLYPAAPQIVQITTPKHVP